MASRLSDWLLGAGIVGRKHSRGDRAPGGLRRRARHRAARDRRARRADAVGRAGRATGLPMPDPPLCEPGQVLTPDGSDIELEAVWSERCRAVPVGFATGRCRSCAASRWRRPRSPRAAGGLPFSCTSCRKCGWRRCARRSSIGRCRRGWCGCSRASRARSRCGGGRRRRPSRWRRTRTGVEMLARRRPSPPAAAPAGPRRPSYRLCPRARRRPPR